MVKKCENCLWYDDIWDWCDKEHYLDNNKPVKEQKKFAQCCPDFERKEK